MQAIQKPAVPGNYGIGRSKPISRITFHHIVGDAPAAIARFQTPGTQVSATYVIGSDGKLYQCVKEIDTPYTDANSDSNSRAITIEHAGPPYAEAMYQTSIQLVRELIDKYGIKDFKRHRDVSDTPTACPGTLDVERIVKEAGEPMLNRGDIINIWWDLYDKAPTEAEIKVYENKPFKELVYNTMLPRVSAFKKKIMELNSQTVVNKDSVVDYVNKNLK